MQTDRLPRLLRLVTLLQSRRGYGVSELTEELEISRRTLFRDLEALEAAGIPYDYDAKSKRYQVRGKFFLPPMQLEVDEAMALSVLASQLARQRQIPFLDGAWRGGERHRILSNGGNPWAGTAGGVYPACPARMVLAFFTSPPIG